MSECKDSDIPKKSLRDELKSLYEKCVKNGYEYEGYRIVDFIGYGGGENKYKEFKCRFKSKNFSFHDKCDILKRTVFNYRSADFWEYNIDAYEVWVDPLDFNWFLAYHETEIMLDEYDEVIFIHSDISHLGDLGQGDKYDKMLRYDHLKRYKRR